MAKWGEGDPRWIVEERADGTNVNNWHWSEKNATPWSKTRLTDLLQGLKIEDGPTTVELTTIKKLEGEATANNRKAKLIFLFEWEIEVNFIGHVAGNEGECKGYVEIPNLSDENEANEVDVNTNISSGGTIEAAVRHLINKKGVQTIQEALAVYIRELKEEFSKGIILPTDKPKPQVITKGKTTVVDKKEFMNNVTTTNSSNGASPPKATTSKAPATPEEVEVKTVSCTESFKVPPQKLWEVLTDRQMVNAWTNGGAAEYDCVPDGKFSLFGGMASGKFLVLDAPREMEFTWRLKSYPTDHYAHVRFTIADKGDSSNMQIEAGNVPVHLSEETEKGFGRYYLQAICRTFGFGTRMF